MAYPKFQTSVLMAPQYISIVEASEIVINWLLRIAIFEPSALKVTLLAERQNQEIIVEPSNPVTAVDVLASVHPEMLTH